MSKYRLQFAKTGEAQFISQLDLVRLFSRALRRARLPIAYSEGFNPHPKMSIGQPLPVGTTSDCEYLEMEFAQEVEPQHIVDALGAALPEGIRAVACVPLDERLARLSDVTEAEYVVTLADGVLSQPQIDAFLARTDIVVDKRTKSGVKPTDIRPLIVWLRADTGGVLYMRLRAGGQGNLKPATVLDALRLYVDGFGCTDFSVHRTAVFCDNGKPLL